MTKMMMRIAMMIVEREKEIPIMTQIMVKLKRKRLKIN
jgi:hypothetical protein